MSNNPAYDPTDPRYYDAKDLRAEAERIWQALIAGTEWAPFGVIAAETELARAK